MKTFREFYLSEEEIDYNARDSRLLTYNNEDEAKTLLRKNKDFVEYINNNPDVRKLDTEDQRDLATAAYVVLKRDPEFASKIGLDIKEIETFEKEMKSKIIDPTRRVAQSTSKNNPTIKEVKAFQSEEPKEKEPVESPAPKKEAPAEEPKATETDSENDADQSNEEPAAREKSSGVTDTGVNREDFPPPKELAKEIENLRDTTVAELENVKAKAQETGKKEKVAAVDRQIKRVQDRLGKHATEARKQQRAYEVSPTRSSQLRGSTKAKQALNKAETEASVAVNNAERGQLAGRAERGVMRVKETGKAIANTAKKVAGSRAAELTGDAVKRGAKVASEKVGQVASKVKENMQSREISKQLGDDRAKEYINALRNDDTTKANKIASEAAKKKQEERKTARYERMEKRVGAGDRAKEALKKAGQTARNAGSSATQALNKVKKRMTTVR